MTDPARTTGEEWRTLFSMELRRGQEIQVWVKGAIDPVMLDAWQFTIDIIKASMSRNVEQALPTEHDGSEAARIGKEDQ